MTHGDGTPTAGMPTTVGVMVPTAVDEAVAGDGSPGPEAAPKVHTTTTAGAATPSMASEVVAGGRASSTDPSASTSPSSPRMAAGTTSVGAGDVIPEEPKVILWHPLLRALGDVSLSRAMCMTHWALNQVHDVLCQESGDLNDEWRSLLLWASMLKEWIAFEKKVADARQQSFNMMEALLEKKRSTLEELNAESQKMLADAKDLYAMAEASANTTIKKEDLTTHTLAVSEQEWVVDEMEHKLKEWEELDDLRLDRELTGLATRESSLNNHEDTLMAERMDFEDARVRLLARELTTDIRESDLNSKAAKLAEKEKQVVERHMQEMAAAQKRLEEL
jgi:hypothetical protein